VARKITSIHPKEIEYKTGRKWRKVIMYSIIAGLNFERVARATTSVRPKDIQCNSGRKWTLVIMYSIISGLKLKGWREK
jgi:hypothetical protein